MNITHYFGRHFEIVPVDTDDLVKEVLRLRYQVYCVERPIFEKKSYPNHTEDDRYDPRSVYRLIRHILSGIYVASVRLILPDRDKLLSRFPMEDYCESLFFDNLEYPENFSRESLAEVSRFLVSKEREREIMEISAEHERKKQGKLGYSRKDGLLCYLLLFGLFSAVVNMTTCTKMTYWYIGVEPSFHRLLKWFGIDFIPIGPPYECHGKRFPCLASTSSVLSGIKKYRPDLWDFLTQGALVIRPIKKNLRATKPSNDPVKLR